MVRNQRRFHEPSNNVVDSRPTKEKNKKKKKRKRRIAPCRLSSTRGRIAHAVRFSSLLRVVSFAEAFASRTSSLFPFQNCKCIAVSKAIEASRWFFWKVRNLFASIRPYYGSMCLPSSLRGQMGENYSYLLLRRTVLFSKFTFEETNV